MGEAIVAELAVPRPFDKSFAALTELEDAAAAALAETVQAAEPFQNLGALQAMFREAFLPERAADAQRLLPALLSLRGQLRTSTPAQIAESVSESVDLDLDEEARKRLRDRLVPLLASNALSTTAGALELLTQHERNYQSARVVTDIRPVFTDDARDRPEGAVIVDTLQLQTWDRGRNAEMLAVAMDETDLRELREVIDRALAKTETLRSFLADQHIVCFELDMREL